jgi:hypothetical protein
MHLARSPVSTTRPVRGAQALADQVMMHGEQASSAGIGDARRATDGAVGQDDDVVALGTAARRGADLVQRALPAGAPSPRDR